MAEDETGEESRSLEERRAEQDSRWIEIGHKLEEWSRRVGEQAHELTQKLRHERVQELEHTRGR